MGMIICPGCSRELHETAQVCPHCGAPQRAERNTVVLVFVALGWTLLLWIMFLFIGGFVIGIMNPENAEVAGREFGETASFPLLFAAGVLSALLTKLGMLPGTRK